MSNTITAWMGQDIKVKVDVLQQTLEVLIVIHEWLLIIDKLVISINKSETFHQCKPFFLHKDLMKEQNLQK